MPIPVLPAVPSTMTPPGRRRPCRSASVMMASAARSFTLPPGLRNSHLPRISQPVVSEARLRRTIGVLPTSAAESGGEIRDELLGRLRVAPAYVPARDDLVSAHMATHSHTSP